MNLFKLGLPKGVEILEFPDLTDALPYGIVNIETAQLRLATRIPQTPNEAASMPGFRTPTGTGDGDYCVFALDESSWVEDPNPLRPAWGVLVSFYRSFSTRAPEELLVKESNGMLQISSYRLGYDRNHVEQLNCGRTITLVDKAAVEDVVFLSDAGACKGSGYAFVDVPLHPGTYNVYVIEDSSKDPELAQGYFPDAHLQFGESVIRSVIAVHESKATGAYAEKYQLDSKKMTELTSAQEDLRVLGKANSGSPAYNAVLESFYISVHSQRFQHATSWCVQGLTFPVEESLTFREMLFDSVTSPRAIDLGWCVRTRGLDVAQVVIPPTFAHLFRS
jgi:hypothetical protein